MPSIQGRTREQLRQHIGYALGGVYVSAASAQGDSDNDDLLDNTLVLGGADTQIGKWIRFTSGSNDALTRRVTDSSITSNVTTLTFMPAVGTRTAADDSYELWEGSYSPDTIDEFINQAILGATGWVYDPIENIELHGDGKQTRFDIPSNISMISKIEYRRKVSSTRIHACGTTFDEVTTPSGFTQELDTKDRKQGTQSLKISLADGASAGAFIADSFTAVNLSAYDTVEMWVKVTGIGSALVAGNLKLHLDNGTVTADGNDKESLNIPGVSPDTWTFARMSLNNPESDTAIASVGLEHDADLGAGVTVWIDDIVAVANDTAEWETLDRRNWKIDKEARDLILVRDGQCVIGYSLIKITGGDKPSIQTSDSDVTEIPEEYIIANAVNWALLSTSGGPATDPDAKRQLSSYWTQRAERSRRGFPMLANVRTVD
tara:strand:- start:1216 stop:2511 length:1296 start_codon:yes stop_codon:yes gene_type:complete